VQEVFCSPSRAATPWLARGSYTTTAQTTCKRSMPLCHWYDLCTFHSILTIFVAGEPRGFCVLSVDKTRKPLIFFKLSPYCINVNEIPCQGTQQFIDSWKNWLLTIYSSSDLNELLKQTLSVLISSIKDLPVECCLHTCRVDVRCIKNKDHVRAITELLGAVQKSDVYATLLPLISKDDGDELCAKLWGPSVETLKKSSSCERCDLYLSSMNVDAATIVAVFLYSWPYNTGMAHSVAAKLSKLVTDSRKKQDLVMQNEILTLQKQWFVILDGC